ncbi:Spy/CpxP family protein refolding chaperone [Algibacter sp. Ld11]|uniref:Spy/CpxP family protein refolding chaperone n=1 Tax=Algibacter sp. Ld11 TaxID=649150 RepID=UPI003868FA51
MKKNIVLYILLVFLVVVNVFFLYNYIGKPGVEERKERQDPMSFIVDELNFNEQQLEAVQNLNKEHHESMMRNNSGIRKFKDALFDKLSDEKIDPKVVDSLARIIALKEMEFDKMAFYHFRDIQELCNPQQKEKFKSIMNDALKKGSNKRERPNKDGGERNGPPPPGGMGGDRQGPPPPPR